MFKSENEHLVPNLLAKTVEEDELQRNTMMRLLRDTSNTQKWGCRLNAMQQSEEKQSLQVHQMKYKAEFDRKRSSEKQNQNRLVNKLSHLLINFDSQQEEDEQVVSEIQIKNEPDLSIRNNNIYASTGNTYSQQLANIPKKNKFLLEMDLQEDQFASSNEQQNQDQQQFAVSNTQIHQSERILKKGFLLQLQIDDDQPTEIADQDGSMQSYQKANPNKRVVTKLATILNRFQNKYYLQPIPQGTVFECVVKRDRCESLVKYHLYDCISLRSFMTIIKDSDGYLVICKEATKFESTPPNERVVGRIVSNFFGTQFNCTLQNIPYTRGYNYPVTPKAQNVITIEYQTNFFGLKGPRKISAFIPALYEHKYQCLNELYQKSIKKKQKPTVLKFKNKTPKWCKDINSYVLNFGGRASVSSIKNFILVGQKQEETAQQKVLFGKFGKQLFNLDVRYPFSILQAVCLAVSSFDRKLGCQ